MKEQEQMPEKREGERQRERAEKDRMIRNFEIN